ncbi:UV DNA damage repair endonuclease UvsE [Romboutsia lituseburensis]|uniref:UV DNA damage repair endonuclease UvsE n=1 Tax=Romboutsia lituseburensis TaxID=1537 RepID=UPI00215A481A|nr:UV DNA damage repair endonuclease UvsE [Romboutsia lituseburensis]MCR8747090.1 UV DNA damage repair endonuclease UvsE [Romboutsia lituseburensis]
MKVRLGYVAIALNLQKVTSSSTVTFARYSKLKEEEKLKKLKDVTYSNIEALEQILNYNIKNNIHFYRITSNLIPLATHPEVLWDYRKYFKKDFEYIGNIIKNSNMRVDTHPDQFNVINSDKESVVENTIKTLNTQVDLFEDINYDNGKLVIHIGGAKGGKDEAIQRFIENLKKFPDRISSRLILENDDKTYTAKEVLDICKKVNLPMVLDVHHHDCNNNGEKLDNLLKDIFETWENENLPPKIHFSSPREFENDRKHSEYIDVDKFIKFLELAKKTVDKDFDIMIEAKQKDRALIKLMDDLKNKRKDFKYIDESTIEI